MTHLACLALFVYLYDNITLQQLIQKRKNPDIATTKTYSIYLLETLDNARMPMFATGLVHTFGGGEKFPLFYSFVVETRIMKRI